MSVSADPDELLEPEARRQLIAKILARGLSRLLSDPTRSREVFCARRSSRNPSRLTPSELASDPHKSVNVTRS
jgi:hypothetical protein